MITANPREGLEGVEGENLIQLSGAKDSIYGGHDKVILVVSPGKLSA